MARAAVVRASLIALAVLAACAREPGDQQDALGNDSAAPPPPLTTEIVGGTDAQPPAAPEGGTPAATPAPQGAATTPATPQTAAPAPAADTGHGAHADSGHTDH